MFFYNKISDSHVFKEKKDEYIDIRSEALTDKRTVKIKRE